MPVTEKLEAALYVRADRIGVQLYGRVVLPADIDPETRAPSFVLIPGTIYDRVDRWQRLELSSMLPTIERQARVLRASSRRPVSLKGAYLDRLVVNLLGGSGASEVFLDDLSVTPVAPEILAVGVETRDAESDLPDRPAAEARNSRTSGPEEPTVRLEANRLRRLGVDRRLHDWLPTAIDAPGADVVRLRQYGFDVLVDDRNSDPERIKTAIEQGIPAHAPAFRAILRDRSQGACSIRSRPIPTRTRSPSGWWARDWGGGGRRRAARRSWHGPASCSRRCGSFLPGRPGSRPGSSTATCTSTRGRPATSTRSGSSRSSGPRRRS